MLWDSCTTGCDVYPPLVPGQEDPADDDPATEEDLVRLADAVEDLVRLADALRMTEESRDSVGSPGGAALPNKVAP